MSTYDFILKMLNLEDKSIIFDNIPFTEDLVRGVRSFVYHAKLIGKPDFCEQCGVVYDNHNMISKGYSKPSRITLPKVSGFNTYLKLTKQRYYCRECNSSFTKRTPIVKKHCFISQNSRISIATSLELKISEKDISKLNNVSPSTVKVTIDSYDDNTTLYKNKLPRVLGFDEFKSVKSADGAMSFIFCDLEKRKLIDIVEDRRIFKLEKYFSYYSKEARDNVETIVIDMYPPYIQLIKKAFPNARIVIDRFHIVQHLSRNFQAARVNVMKGFKKKSLEYRLYKKYWKLLTLDYSKLNTKKYKYWWRNGQQLNQKQFIELLLSYDKSIYDSYWLYQGFIKALRNNDEEKLTEIIKSDLSQYPDQIQRAIKTFKTYNPYIINTLNCEYNNGYVEGTNNLIKVIKRVSFGYRNFYNLRRRILITRQIIDMKKEVRSQWT